MQKVHIVISSYNVAGPEVKQKQYGKFHELFQQAVSHGSVQKGTINALLDVARLGWD